MRGRSSVGADRDSAAALLGHLLSPPLGWFALCVPGAVAWLQDRGGRWSKAMSGWSLLSLWFLLGFFPWTFVTG